LGETTTSPRAATCEKCDVGKFGATKGVCSTCPPGKYQDGKGETECKNCPVDTYGMGKGKSSLADCTKCDEDRTTGTRVGMTEKLSCLCRREKKTNNTFESKYYQDDQLECQLCPMGADCSAEDGLTIEFLTSEPG
jgi:hypothetical protein